MLIDQLAARMDVAVGIVDVKSYYVESPEDIAARVRLCLQHAPAESVWILHAYQLAVVATLLPFATLGDLWGARRVFLAGVAVFNLAAISSALAPSLEWLAISRAVQGIGASGLMSVNLALVHRIFPPQQLGRGAAGVVAAEIGHGHGALVPGDARRWRAP